MYPSQTGDKKGFLLRNIILKLAWNNWVTAGALCIPTYFNPKSVHLKGNKLLIEPDIF